MSNTWKLRLAGGAWLVIGAAQLIALVTPARDWVLSHNIGDVTSLVDRRASSSPGGTDTAETVVIGGVLAVIVGLWVGWGVPFVIDRGMRRRRDGTTTDEGTRLGWIMVVVWILLWLAMLGGLALWAPFW